MYDGNGNRINVTVNNGVPSWYNLKSKSNQLVSIDKPPVTLTYDAAGNTTSDGSFTLQYDLRGRLAKVTNAQGSTSYTYDNNGLRVRKSNGTASGTTVFAYDAEGHMLGEYDGSGNPIREIVWLEDMPLAVFTPDSAMGANAATAAPQIFYIHADHLNTPRVVVDKANTVRWRWMSEPFGTTAAETSPAGQADFVFNLRFPGQYYDVESGIHQNWNRDYVPGLGRYAQSDPIGLRGGNSTYAYVGGNPLTFFDPNGLQASYNGVDEGSGWIYDPCFDFSQFANQIEENRSNTAADLAALTAAGAVGTMPKTPGELRGLGVPKSQLNPYTSQMSRWSSRVGVRELRVIGRTAGGVALGAAATGALIFDGFYNWGVIGKAAWDASSLGGNCGCGSK
ncbi:hypothetical protein M5C99_13555 [Acidovorax sp. NCPPB 2350]|nr:hypothetical protein M5C99_13555 [Acidovorax sp. NCPPB 2350]